MRASLSRTCSTVTNGLENEKRFLCEGKVAGTGRAVLPHYLNGLGVTSPLPQSESRAEHRRVIFQPSTTAGCPYPTDIEGVGDNVECYDGGSPDLLGGQ